MGTASRFEQHVPDSGVWSIPSGVEVPLQWLGFWTAVVTPFVILSLLLAGFAQQYPLLLGGLLTANVSGLVLGRNHNQ